MSSDAGEERIPPPDPREPTGPKPAPRVRAWAITIAIIGVILALVIATWLIAEPDNQAGPETQPMVEPFEK